MSRTYRNDDQDKKRTDHRKGGRARKHRQLSVRGIRRDTPDLQRISRAVIALAIAEAERDAAASEKPKRETGDD